MKKAEEILNNKKNILLIYTKLAVGGAPKRVILFAGILNEAGFKVTVAARKGLLVNNLIEKNIDYLKLDKNFGSRGAFKQLISYLNSIIIVFKEVKRKNIGIIHNASRYTSILCLVVSKIAKIKFFSSAHIDYKDKTFLRNWSWGEKVFAVSNGVKQHLIKAYNVKSEKIYVIQNSIPRLKRFDVNELNKFKNSICVNNKRICCCIARFSESKGQKYLLKAWAHILKQSNNTILLLVGYGENEYLLKNIVNDNSLTNSVLFLPRDVEIAKVIGISDFLVLPSLREGLPTVVLESFSVSKPVVATNIPGTNEIVKNNINGILVPPNDVYQLAEAIRLLLEDKNLLNRLGKMALKTYNEVFSFEKYKEKIIDFFTTARLK